MAIVSAPGKVLIAGGYLVLERPNPGLVLSTSARFYASVRPWHSISEDSAKFWSFIDVRVSSPQMGSVRSYKLLLRSCKLDISSTKKSFVENAIEYAIATALAVANVRETVYERLLQGLDIEIKGSNDFYSFRKVLEERNLPLTAASLASLPQFHAISRNDDANSGVTSPEVAKTGLGSSAAMTTAIVAGILEYLGVIHLSSGSNAALDIVHAASQAAHCHAQGKIGSGFDVSAAVYGSQRYVRFSPQVLSPAMDPVDDNGKPKSLEKAMKSVLDMKSWDSQRSNFSLPPMLFLVLGESGRGGSHTPSMVGAVNTWREKHPDAETCWKALAEANKSVETDLLNLRNVHDIDPEAYTFALEACSNLDYLKWSHLNLDERVVTALLKIREDFKIVRSLLRKMGEEAKVPLEPGPQTELLDEIMQLPGVLFGGVPGAGGWDAVFAITIGKNSRCKVAQRWSEKSILTLTVDEDPRGVCVEDKEPTTQGGTGLENQVASIQLR